VFRFFSSSTCISLLPSSIISFQLLFARDFIFRKTFAKQVFSGKEKVKVFFSRLERFSHHGRTDASFGKTQACTAKTENPPQ
jgi:hypothetical protein